MTNVIGFYTDDKNKVRPITMRKYRIARIPKINRKIRTITLRDDWSIADEDLERKIKDMDDGDIIKMQIGGIEYELELIKYMRQYERINDQEAYDLFTRIKDTELAIFYYPEDSYNKYYVDIIRFENMNRDFDHGDITIEGIIMSGANINKNIEPKTPHYYIETDFIPGLSEDHAIPIKKVKIEYGGRKRSPYYLFRVLDRKQIQR